MVHGDHSRNGIELNFATNTLGARPMWLVLD